LFPNGSNKPFTYYSGYIIIVSTVKERDYRRRIMMVYVVMFGYDMEGLWSEDSKSFKDENKAKEYGEKILSENSLYHYYEVIPMEVE
jgi:hypothetical protein